MRITGYVFLESCGDQRSCTIYPDTTEIKLTRVGKVDAQSNVTSRITTTVEELQAALDWVKAEDRYRGRGRGLCGLRHPRKHVSWRGCRPGDRGRRMLGAIPGRHRGDVRRVSTRLHDHEPDCGFVGGAGRPGSRMHRIPHGTRETRGHRDG